MYRRRGCMRVRDREFVPSTPRGMQKMQQKIPQLDAVGGFAILVVILHNASLKYPALPRGHVPRCWMGVDLFFALSGLWTAGILVDTKQSGGFFKNFNVRRCLRICPCVIHFC